MARDRVHAHDAGAGQQAALLQLSEMRKMRKGTDDTHQAMLNRISFLRSEEAKLDRDIETAKRRALELLTRKAEKAEKQGADDVVATAKDILEAVGPTVGGAKPPRPTTGRSSLHSSFGSHAGPLATDPPPAPTAVSGSPQAGTSPSTPALLRSVSAQRSSGRPSTSASGSGQPLRPTKPLPSSPAATPHAAKRSSSSPLPGKERGSTTAAAAAAVAAAAATAGTAGRPPVTPSSGTRSKPSSSKDPSTPRLKKPPTSPPKAAAASTAALATALTVPSTSAVDNGNAMQQLDAGNGLGDRGQLGRQQLQTSAGQVNRMDAIGGGRGAAGDADPELIEELIASTSAGAEQQRQAQSQQLVGLQQFSTENAARVVHVKATHLRQQQHPDAGSSAAVVMAAGVGWGLGHGGTPGSIAASTGTGGLVVDATEKARLQAELAKKRQLRGVRKAFGLQPTQLQDSSAQVEECGAGSWQ